MPTAGRISRNHQPELSSASNAAAAQGVVRVFNHIRATSAKSRPCIFNLPVEDPQGDLLSSRVSDCLATPLALASSWKHKGALGALLN